VSAAVFGGLESNTHQQLMQSVEGFLFAVGGAVNMCV
jgi:hypothetical protein